MPGLSDLTRPWEIWLVHHTHVDIGYTEPQEIVLRKHAEFVAQALDYCAATDALPAGERFCWTCEVAWTVKAFLARYPERAAEFFRRVREGRIEVTALYLQLTDLFTLELLEETTDYALGLGRQHGFEVVTAMNDDVNGWAWGLPDLLARAGVRYLDTAINETRALGVRPRPALFRWAGPTGGSVLFWHSHGYLTGNGLGFHQPGAEERVAECLKTLEGSGYPHHLIEVRIHGAHHDNAPPGLWISEAVRAWNAAQPTPQLRLVTPRQWFEEAAARWPEPVTEHRAGWPDWWADGNGSAARESALARTAQADLVTLKALAVATGQTPPADRLERAREAAAFFCEHTWGAWCSTDDPNCLTSQAQWNTKAGFAYTAAVESRRLVEEALAAKVRRPGGGPPGVLVFNPSNHVRSDLVELTVADADLNLPAAGWVPAPVRAEAGAAFHLVDEATGAAVPVWREPAMADSARRPAQLLRFLARDVPAVGFRCYGVAAGEVQDTDSAPQCGAWRPVVHDRTGPRRETADPHGPGGPERTAASGKNLEVSPATDGPGIVIRDRSTGAPWSATVGEFALGEVIYETIPGPFGREKLAGWGGIRRDCAFQRTRLRFGVPEPIKRPYGAGLRFASVALPGSLRSLTLEVMVFDDLPRVDLCYRLEKIPTAEAEALYVAFPLAGTAGEGDPGRQVSGVRCQGDLEPETLLRPAGCGGPARNLKPPTVHLEVPGAVLRPGLDQVPGTATDWHSLQHYFAVTAGDRTIVVASPDIPLVQVNGVNTGKWQETLPPPNGLVMSWVMNNYWFTNFPAAQGGEFAWRYSLTAFPGGFDRDACSRFAATVRRPLVATVIPARSSTGPGDRYGDAANSVLNQGHP